MNKTLAASVLALLIAVSASAKNMYIPTAGVAPGANGTFWRTDLQIYNPSTTDDIEVSLHFVPQGMDGRFIPGRSFRVAKGGVLILNNVVARLWPDTPHIMGSIRIDSDTYTSFEFIASSRTYTDSLIGNQPGTHGQFVRALNPAEAKKTTILLHGAATADFRTNIGAMNPGLEPATLKVTLLNHDGSVFESREGLTVPPRSMEQWSLSALFGGLYSENALVRIESTVPVFTWGSVVDNYSGDAIFVNGVTPANAD
jgi:hypothetical protein